MRSVIISSDFDILTGLRIAGIVGVFCKNDSEISKNFNVYKNKDDIGIIIFTQRDFKVIEDDILEFKLNNKTPLIVTIPDIGKKLESDFILKYIKSSVGI